MSGNAGDKARVSHVMFLVKIPESVTRNNPVSSQAEVPQHLVKAEIEKKSRATLYHSTFERVNHPTRPNP